MQSMLPDWSAKKTTRGAPRISPRVDAEENRIADSLQSGAAGPRLVERQFRNGRRGCRDEFGR